MAKLEGNIIIMWNHVQYVCGGYKQAHSVTKCERLYPHAETMMGGALTVHFPTMMHSSFITNVCYVDTTMGGLALRCNFR